MQTVNQNNFEMMAVVKDYTKTINYINKPINYKFLNQLS